MWYPEIDLPFILNYVWFFLYTAVQLVSREKSTVTKCGFSRSATQKAMGILKHWATMLVTYQWEIRKLGGEILEL